MPRLAYISCCGCALELRVEEGAEVAEQLAGWVQAAPVVEQLARPGYYGGLLPPSEFVEWLCPACVGLLPEGARVAFTRLAAEQREAHTAMVVGAGGPWAPRRGPKRLKPI